MLENHPRTNPAIHELAIRIARRTVAIILPLLRQEEVHEALEEFYLATCQELDASPIVDGKQRAG